VSTREVNPIIIVLYATFSIQRKENPKKIEIASGKRRSSRRDLYNTVDWLSLT
jgi:hypothetical protein